MEKIKMIPVEHLINVLRDKVENNLPKYCLLIGAGCSYRSNIPLGSQVIEMLKVEVFRRENLTDADLAERLRSLTTFFDYKSTFDSFLSNNGKQSVYGEFVKKHNHRLKKEVDSLSTAAITKLLPVTERTKDANQNQIKFQEIKSLIYQDYAYGYWFKQYSVSARDRQEFIEKLIKDKQPMYGYVSLANLIQSNYVRTTFTTNFDDLLNEALVMYYFCKSKVVAHSTLGDFLDLRSLTPNIVKIHGDYLFNDIRNTDEEINIAENTLNGKLYDALCDKFGLIVLGYNGADYAIMECLEQAKMRRSGSPFPLLWCDRKDPAELHWRVRRLLESTSNSFYVQIESFDVLMVKIELALELKRVNLNEDAIRRQKEIDKFYAEAEDEIKDAATLTKKEKKEFDKLAEAARLMETARLEESPEKAIEIYTKALDLEPNNSYIYSGLSARLRAIWEKDKSQIGVLEEATEKIKRAIQLNPKVAKFYSSWSWFLRRLWEFQGEPEGLLFESIEILKKEIELAPYSYPAYNNLGLCFLRLHRSRKEVSDVLLIQAEECFNHAISINPASYICEVNMADLNMAFWRLKRNNTFIDSAVEHYLKALTIKPDYITGLNNLAGVFYLQGNLTGDKEFYRKSYKLRQKVLKNNTEDVYALGGSMRVLFKLQEGGYLQDIQLLLTKIKSLNKAWGHYYNAVYSVLSGQEDRALKELESCLNIKEDVVTVKRHHLEQAYDFEELLQSKRLVTILNKYRPLK